MHAPAEVIPSQIIKDTGLEGMVGESGKAELHCDEGVVGSEDVTV